MSILKDTVSGGIQFRRCEDGSTSLAVNGGAMFGNIPNFIGYLNGWYTAEVMSGDRDDHRVSATAAIEQAREIAMASLNVRVRKSLAGASDRTLSVWQKGEEQGNAVDHLVAYMRDNKEQFIKDETQHMVNIQRNGSEIQSAHSVYFEVSEAQRDEHAVDRSVWDTASARLSSADAGEVLTSKVAMVEEEEGGKPGETDMACVAFMAPLVATSHHGLESSFKAAAASAKGLAPATIRAMAYRSLAKKRPARLLLVNKEASVEKDRMIAMVGFVLRWMLALLEVVSETHLNEAYCPVNFSALNKPNKDALMREGIRKLTAEAKRIRGSIIFWMSDASAWGPWKSIVSMYAVLVGRGAPKSLLVLLRACLEGLATKEVGPTKAIRYAGPQLLRSIHAQRGNVTA
jgi:hypothetical protein